MHVKLMDGSSPFHVEPYNLAHSIRDNAIRNIEVGFPYLTEATIPSLEREAIARIKAQTKIRQKNEIKKTLNSDLWRKEWVNAVRVAEKDIYSYGPVPQAAIRVVLTSDKLRSAMDQNSSPQMIAALSMLLVCEALEGGYLIKFETIKTENETIKKKKQEIYLKSIGIESEDQKKVRKESVEIAKKLWELNPRRLIGNVSENISKQLLERIEEFPTLDLTPKPDTIKGWLRDECKEGRLAIPEAAQKRGRPKKT